MRQLVARILLLLPATLTVVPFPEMLLPMYYLMPSVTTAVVVFVLAVSVSCAQMLYQYWAVGELERWAPSNWISTAGAWLNKQVLVQWVLKKTGLTLFLLGLIPGIRLAGTTLWQNTKHPWGGYLLAGGTAIQLALVFGGILGLGRLVAKFFR